MADEGRFALFDDENGGAVILTDFRRIISFSAAEVSDAPADPVAQVFAAIEDATEHGEWVALAVDYEFGACLEPGTVPDCPRNPLLHAWVFGESRSLDAQAVDRFLRDRMARLPDWQQVAGIAELASTTDAPRHAECAEQIRRWITEGDCYQVNLTFPLTFRIYGHPLALYARLRERQPVRYGGFIDSPEATLLSFSPELFFERRGDQVLTRPMKGTASRGSDPQSDRARRDALLASEKERAENIMIVDLLRNDLSRVAAPGRVRVEALCDVEAYPTLWQMVSTVAADLPGVSLLELFRALFPCGSITGAPKIRAMQRIAELERSPRDVYTGAFGWVAPGGNCRFNVAIRTIEASPDGCAKLGVGSGIVIDADPAREYAECLLKSHFLSGFDPGFELIETLRLEQGNYPLLRLHRERIEESARALGFSCDMAAIRKVLEESATHHTKEVWRVRLTLKRNGEPAVKVTPLTKLESRLKLAIGAEQVDSSDYLLRHKTTARARYDRALAGYAEQPEVFDVLFFNQRDEVCEGARSNVFVAVNDGAGEVLLTPPMSCGLLPGVMRRQLIESGRAVERVLYREDLLGASQIYVANALRGLLPVTLLP